MKSTKRICIVTSGHLSTCPRMLKAADAFFEAGYLVRVVSASYMAGAREADQHLRHKRTWAWSVFDYERSRSRFNHLRTAVRFRFAQRIARALGPEHISFPLAARAFSRAYPELLRLVLSEPVDFIYGGTSGGLAVAFGAAQKLGVPFALDLEDFHIAEQTDTPSAQLAQNLIAGIQGKILGRAVFVTVASPGVGDAVRNTNPGITPVPIMNVFPLADRPERPPVPRNDRALRLYWFSQTIGNDRGLTEALRAVALLPRGSVELHLRGRWSAGYEPWFRQAWSEANLDPKQLIVHDIGSPDEMVTLAAQHDIGLALEVPSTQNRTICMNDLCTNKVFTYLLAGLALATSGVGETHEVYDGAGFAYPYGRPEQLAAICKRWLDDRAALQRAKDVAWRLGGTRYNWDLEKAKLLAAVNQTLNKN